MRPNNLNEIGKHIWFKLTISLARIVVVSRKISYVRHIFKFYNN